MKQITHLPLNKFLALARVSNRQPDPVPGELLAALFLFVATALVVL